jgi:hypothetical protein
MRTSVADLAIRARTIVIYLSVDCASYTLAFREAIKSTEVTGHAAHSTHHP